ncbi:ABC-2 type transport system ATP-binding protein [Pseudonocardia ammonioxydans]|uniref:ABC-2 type transport system ATP-binding protein n=1 Tax=Pseudonocardia ammonioxydans TaxID=260086 RepID=A0A1I5BIG2_PSUAM|nr:ABC transporter ATP-binding protein [Pseudonocardia ammonioxydans]SFN74426.1 ABC-2 type transport system ATP-binding protein [Pseudonocardia ammonioxydans]
MTAIEVHDLHKSYRGRVAVDGVGFTAADGSVTGVLGPNGAGKTTTVECIAGLRRPDRGTVRVLGLDPRRDRRALRAVLGVQLQEAALHDMLTVAELVRVHRSMHRDGADPERLIAAVGLEESAGTRFDRLSGGQQQRLSVALALVGAPRVVILDELTTGLDPRSREDVLELVRELAAGGVTVLMVSHRMDEIERLCDRVLLLDDGRLVADANPAGLISAAGLTERVRFRTAGGFDRSALLGLSGVDEVTRVGEEVVVSGAGDLVGVVGTELVRQGVVATGLREQRPTLDDAFLELTGRRLDAGRSSAGRNSAGRNGEVAA